jgi:hypothetical protein
MYGIWFEGTRKEKYHHRTRTKYIHIYYFIGISRIGLAGRVDVHTYPGPPKIISLDLKLYLERQEILVIVSYTCRSINWRWLGPYCYRPYAVTLMSVRTVWDTWVPCFSSAVVWTALWSDTTSWSPNPLDPWIFWSSIG